MEVAVTLLAAAAAKEDTRVTGDLVACNGNVFKDLLFHCVFIGVEGSDGDFQHVLLCMWHGKDIKSFHTRSDIAHFRLL